MKTLRRFNRMNGTTKRKIAIIRAYQDRVDNDPALRHAMDRQRRYRECARRAMA